MEVRRMFIFSLLLIVTWCLDQTESGLIKCNPDEFYVADEDICKPCSTCKVNEIIRKTCSTYEDTQCGPFKEFMKFLQRSDNDGTKDKQNKTHHNHHHKNHHEGTSSTSLPTSISNKSLDLTSVSSGEEQWRTLAMGLIGILCVVSVFLAFFVFAVCYIKYKRPVVEKDIIYDPEYISTSPSDTYIEVKPYFTSRDLLKPNENGYDSGSDDGCYPGTVRVAQSSRLIAPVFIPPISDEYDADHSGVSTLKSDYVYFNCPQNGNQAP